MKGTLPAETRSLAVPELELTVERDAGVGAVRTVIVNQEVWRIGSHPSNDLVLADPRVSRFHCRIERDESAWRIRDEGSLNGTAIDGIRVREAELRMPECRLQIGDSVLRVSELASTAHVELSKESRFGALRGESVAMQKLYAVLERVAGSDASVLIEGESGTGKELVAAEIVRRGRRAEKPFVVVDCGAISPSLIESELFGHARGAFTGADRERSGAFEAAHDGTVFLDEIGEMPLDMQPKLLRALEAREVRRVGETRARKVDVRVVAATNRRLEREVNHRRFREDLFFRLSVVTVRIPPLRERVVDIPLLVRGFLESLGAPEAQKLFTRDILDEMARYDWPGNVRELRNHVERTVVMQDATHARASDAPDDDPASQRSGDVAVPDLDVPFRIAKDRLVNEFERRYLTDLLAWAGGNVSRAARRAKMDRMNLHRLVQLYGLRAGRSFDDE